MTVYQLKPRFQAALRPLVRRLPAVGITANMVTIAALAGSLVTGAVIASLSRQRSIFLLMPIWLLVRMALNAIDGMLARECNQESVLGAYLNELGDVVSDAALYAPFALVLPFDVAGVAALIVLSTLTEFAGALGPAMGASRRYDGPLGKSDRAVLFGALGVWVATAGSLPNWMWCAVPVVSILLLVTTINRIRAGIGDARRARLS